MVSEFSKKENKKIKELIKALLSLKNKNEARRFLRDLLTKAELIEFANRWKAAKMLSLRITYRKIVIETGLSSRTVARISKWLNKGVGGYKLMLKKINHHNNLSPSGKRLR